MTNINDFSSNEPHRRASNPNIRDHCATLDQPRWLNRGFFSQTLANGSWTTARTGVAGFEAQKVTRPAFQFPADQIQGRLA